MNERNNYDFNMYTLYCTGCHKDIGITTMATVPPPYYQQPQQPAVDHPRPIVISGTPVIQQELPPVKSYIPHIVIAVFTTICCGVVCGFVALIFAGKSLKSSPSPSPSSSS